MSFRYRKSVNLGAGIRLNLSKTGVGISAGVPGARYSVHSSGRTVRTVGVPGTGMYFRKDTYSGSRKGVPRAKAPIAPPQVQMYPKAGLLAPKEEKLFVQGVTAYMQGRYQQALDLFVDVSARDAGQHVGEEFFEALCLIALDRAEEAISPFEAVLGSHQPIPDTMMVKHKVGGDLMVQVTPFTSVRLPMSSLAAALMLAEVYQHTERAEQAIDLLESLGATVPDPIFALSLADLYDGTQHWRDVVRVTDEFATNTDDVTLGILCYRANALKELNLYEAALATAKEALRFKKREPALLRLARLVRGQTYEASGKASLARKEYERIYAEDPSFADVAIRLGQNTPPLRPDGVGSR